MTDAVAAVDLGATSGRVMLGYLGHDELRLVPVARFPNQPVRTVDGLHWNILELYRNVVAGLGSAVREEPGLRSIGIDSWAVDYALLDGDRMLGTPFHYRDDRTSRGVDLVHGVAGFDELYGVNGLQFLPFNTLYQLAAEKDGGWLERADTMLLVPDLLAFWLTGARRAEATNASTTGLVNVTTGQWDDALIGRLGYPRGVFPPLVHPGATIGTLLPGVAAEIGMSGSSLPVTAVGSHDTASAVVAVPAATENVAYISSGTWSLVGVELDRPVVSEAARAANFTNEGGVDGRIRFLQNVSGLWLLSESVRTWERESGSGESIDLPTLLAQAAAVTAPMPVFDAGDPVFIAPGDMPGRIAAWCAERGLAVPGSRAEVVRSILESLAAAYASSLRQASELSGRRVDTVHVVGGGSQNALLCQLTADRTGLPVVAGPVEATAIGNVLVQARAQGMVDSSTSLEALRALVARAFPLVTYTPTAG
ncbi:rhamnulokinase family protein [Herbiconiux sp. KACC 21604]|uniref:rhamnulokinase n=1 Tax=unclassified Herbiconiux TaxID=2618217 RepID=UPI00149299E7|nr:rhamnulokinase family protein [Herbiconiux sp. SALV-R1]QJU52608.1 rhamnulokinase [Herbiconiux sp. SALV-R1]WPO87498.1 rhamnulokinase family protein [Herbiconiux sp. KACC 21604]